MLDSKVGTPIHAGPQKGQGAPIFQVVDSGNDIELAPPLVFKDNLSCNGVVEEKQTLE
jgi:hypothetical protein